MGYKIKGLQLSKEDCIDNKGSVIGIYKYNSIYDMNQEQLHRAGIIQVKATSFTVSEPYQKYCIEPLIYKLSNDNEKKILEEQFNVSKFDINIIKIERMFIDKIFATEFYYIRNMFKDTSKHLYDISVLFENDNIKNLLNNKGEQESVRIGGINASTKIKDFNYFKLDFSEELVQEFNYMQHKYVLDDKYKINISEVKKRLSNIYNYVKNF